MDWRDEIIAAQDRIEGHVRRTPVAVLTLSGLADPCAVKLEQLQHTGSFKARGAFNALLSAQVPARGVVAASGGNHGAAVAFAAARLGIPAQIFVPEMAGASKIALIRRFGAEMTVVPGAYADAFMAAQAHEAATGADTVLIAVGGGGLGAGAIGWLQDRRRVVLVEPRTSCALHAALAAGAPVDVEVSGVAANALGARRIGRICFDLARRFGARSVLVDDDAILQAQRVLWQEIRQLVEPAGATALAALLSGAYQPEAGERVAVLVCGANPAPDPLN